MIQQIILGDITVDVELKAVKRLNLRVHPRTGKVRVSAPLRMKIETIRAFVRSKQNWIKRHQGTVQEQEKEMQREYVDMESHPVWGRRYRLKVIEKNGTSSIELKQEQMILRVRPGASRAEKEAAMEAWYSEKMRDAVPPLIDEWQQIMGVTVKRFSIRRMKTRWGSCTPHKNTIRLNTELAKKPVDCLESVVVHEMVHLLEPTHNARFVKLMDQFMPKWRSHKELLKQLPIPE